MQCFVGLFVVSTSQLPPRLFLRDRSTWSAERLSVKSLIPASSRRLPSWPIRQISLLRRRTLCSGRRRRWCISGLTRLLLGRIAVLALLWRLNVGVRWRLLMLLWWWRSDVLVWILRGRRGLGLGRITRRLCLLLWRVAGRL